MIKKLIENVVKDELQRLDEKLITFSDRAPYGQVVFLAGGAGSGKGFAADNFLDTASFKTIDVDEWKKAFLKLSKLKDKYPEIQGLDLQNPKDVSKLHMFVKDKGIRDKTINMILSQAKEGRLPNLLFDVTMKDVKKLKKYIPMLRDAGYEAENIHLIWILTSYHIAVSRNKNRERIVPDNIMIKTHRGAAKTMYEILEKGAKSLPKGLDGRIDVILNNTENTVFFTDEDGDPIKVTPEYEGGDDEDEKGLDTGNTVVIRDFLSLPIKKEGGGLYPEESWRKTLYSWMKDNIPQEAEQEVFGK